MTFTLNFQKCRVVWEFEPKSEKSPLNKAITIKQKVTGILHFDESGNKFGVKKEITKTIFDENRKRKDFGEFKKFLKDRRLPELFEYFEENEIKLQNLKDQLSDYSKYRDLILDKVFELEKAVIDSLSDEDLQTKILNKGKYNNVQHSPYLNYLKLDNLIDENEFLLLSTIRNAFSHNQFPPKIIMDKYITWQDNESLSKQIFESYEAKIKEIIVKL